MPFYEFSCTLGHETERRASFETQAIACPACGLDAVRSPVNRVQFHLASPRGEKVSNYLEAAQTLEDRHDSSDDPAVQAATRPDVWRPAYYRARAKELEENHRWFEPKPHETDREVQALS